MKWIAVLDKMLLVPVIQSLRRIQNRMHCPNQTIATTDNKQSYENVSRHKQPNN